MSQQNDLIRQRRGWLQTRYATSISFSEAFGPSNFPPFSEQNWLHSAFATILFESVMRFFWWLIVARRPSIPKAHQPDSTDLKSFQACLIRCFSWARWCRPRRPSIQKISPAKRPPRARARTHTHTQKKKKKKKKQNILKLLFCWLKALRSSGRSSGFLQRFSGFPSWSLEGGILSDPRFSQWVLRVHPPPFPEKTKNAVFGVEKLSLARFGMLCHFSKNLWSGGCVCPQPDCPNRPNASLLTFCSHKQALCNHRFTVWTVWLMSFWDCRPPDKPLNPAISVKGPMALSQCLDMIAGHECSLEWMLPRLALIHTDRICRK